MKVVLKQIRNGEIIAMLDLTIGKVYDVTEVDSYGDAWIVDDVGDVNTLYLGEFEVVEE